MNLREKYPEERCPVMTFLPKRIPNWLEELKVMTNYFGIRVTELKSCNSKLSPTNLPFFRDYFSELPASPGDPVAQAGLSPSLLPFCTSGAPCCPFMIFPSVFGPSSPTSSVCVSVHFTVNSNLLSLV